MTTDSAATVTPSELELLPSVYYAESVVRCPLDEAWHAMLDYQAWNPNFTNAQVTLVDGVPGQEGELNLISIHGGDGAVLAEFYSRTVKLVLLRHVVWYVYPKQGESFRNFVDFWLEQTESGVRFRIFYYAQNWLSCQQLSQERASSEAALNSLAAAFKQYCESPH